MPGREYHFWVYILSSRSRNLYVGVTNKLIGRTGQHRGRGPGSFTNQYNIHRLVYYEHFSYVYNAIALEKELKRWTREQKIALIEGMNPTWEDLYMNMTVPEQRVPYEGKGVMVEGEGEGEAEAKTKATTEADPLRG